MINTSRPPHSGKLRYTAKSVTVDEDSIRKCLRCRGEMRVVVNIVAEQKWEI